MRVYQIICSSLDEVDLVSNAMFEGTIADADNVFGLRVNATEADLLDFVRGGVLKTRGERLTIRYREMTESELEAYIESPMKLFENVLLTVL